MKLVLYCVLLMVTAPGLAHGQEVRPATAHDGLTRLLAPHFGGRADATVDYLGQLLVNLVDSGPLGTPLQDHARTIGRTRSAVIGAGYRMLRFRTFGGFDLDSGELSSFSGGLARVPVTYVTTATVSADLTTGFVAVAVSPRVDVGVTAPVVRVHVSGEFRAVEDMGTPSEELAAPTLRVVQSTFTTLGDVSTDVKWQFLDAPRVQMSGLGGVRWPTGGRDNLTSAGRVVPKAGLVASLAGSDALTLNGVLTFAKGKGGAQVREVTTFPFSAPTVTRVDTLDRWAYGASGEWTLDSRVTIRSHALFQTLPGAVAYNRADVRSSSATQTQSRLIPLSSALTTGSVGAGVTVRVSRLAVLSLVIGLPIGPDRGLQPGLTPMLGVQLGR